MGMVLSLVSRKGGCSKTTTAINLAASFAAEGARVLVVDLDSQASLSQFYLGSEAVDSLRESQTVSGLFDGRTVQDVAQETTHDGVWLLPATFSLKVPQDGTLPLRAAREYDAIICDTPPDTNSHAIRAALLESHFAISPTIPESFGVQSIRTVQELVASVSFTANRDLRLLGYFVAMRQRLAIHTAVEQVLRRIHGTQVFDSVVPSLVSFKEAVAAGKSIRDYAPESKASKAVDALRDEILERADQATRVGRAA